MRELKGGVALRVGGLALAGANNVIGGQLGHMFCCKAVNRQAVVAAIRFRDGKADAVTRFYVERFAQRTEQRSPRIERDRALREGHHHVGREPDVLGERIERCFGIGRYVFRL
ncbi:hypothetical protein D3C85_1265250 [compost metagenome]